MKKEHIFWAIRGKGSGCYVASIDNAKRIEGCFVQMKPELNDAIKFIELEQAEDVLRQLNEINDEYGGEDGGYEIIKGLAELK